MKTIGYKRAIVMYGAVDGTDKGMDEASVCGTTYAAELMENGDIEEFTFRPTDMGIALHMPDDLLSDNSIEHEARRFVAMITGMMNGARTDAAVLNAGLIYYISGIADDIPSGVLQARQSIENGMAYDTLENWVSTQNRNPQKGMETLRRFCS